MTSPLLLVLTTAAVLLGFFFIYVIICGTHSCHRNGPIARLYNLLIVRLPLRLCNLLARVLPCIRRAPAAASSRPVACRYFMALIFGAIYFYLVIDYYSFIYPLLDAEFPYPTAMKLISFFVTPWPVVLFIVFQFADPGEILPTNVKSYLDRYPPDGMLYTESFAEGTRMPIVPRSHFCSRTRRWVAKFDHYCPWVAQPIGERTFRLFLLFLLSCLGIAVTGWVGFTMFFWTRVKLYPNLTAWQTFVTSCVVASDHVHELMSWSLTLAVNLVLLMYMMMLCLQGSRNETSIEWTKRREWKKKNPGKKFVNAYDKGFLANWKAALFPAQVKMHPPFEPGKKAK
jgi:hypothetical protein